MIFTKILYETLKQDLTLQILKQADYYLKEKIKSSWTNETRIRWENHKKFFGLRAKLYSYLKENNFEDKKLKGTKIMYQKKKRPRSRF